MVNWTHRLFEMIGLGDRNRNGRLSGDTSNETSREYADNSYEGFEANSVVTRMLRNLQTKWETRPIDEGRGTNFHFVYQRGDFHVLTHRDNRQARIHFLYFYELPLGQLDNVRTACNHFNQHFTELKAIYSIDAEKHVIHVHLASSIRLTLWNKALEEDFADLLTVFFEAARSYRRHIDEIIAQDVYNFEERDAFSEREAYLAYETEMEHQDVRWHTYDTEHLSLADAMAIALGTDDVYIDDLRVLPTGGQPVENTELETQDAASQVSAENVNGETLSPSDFDLTNLALALTPKSAPEVLIEFYAETPAYKAHYLMRIEYGYPMENTQFFRITLYRQPSLPGIDNAISTNDTDNDRIRTFVMSYRTMDNAKKQAEFDYMWQEAREKKMLEKDLTAEERFITLCETPDVGFNLYWGRRFYLSKVYYRALLHLENAYRSIYRNFQRFNKKERLQFYELSYFIGLCYMHLGQPKQAYYYLDGLFNLNNIRYTQAYVNALVRSHDYRAPQIVHDLLRNVSKVYDEQQEDADEQGREQLRQFILFLRRTVARIYLSDGLLDEAEKALRELLPDDKEHETRILEQLAEVARLRALEASANTDRTTLSVSAEFPKADNNQSDQ